MDNVDESVLIIVNLRGLRKKVVSMDEGYDILFTKLFLILVYYLHTKIYIIVSLRNYLNHMIKNVKKTIQIWQASL